jgi:hypothetical protein
MRNQDAAQNRFTDDLRSRKGHRGSGPRRKRLHVSQKKQQMSGAAAKRVQATESGTTSPEVPPSFSDLNIGPTYVV